MSKEHPVVEAYISTQKTLVDILAEVPQDPVTEAMAMVRDLRTKPPSAIELMAPYLETVYQNEVLDNNLAIMYLALWRSIAHLAGKTGDANALVKRMGSLEKDDTPPELKALISLHDQKHRLEKQILKRVPPHTKIPDSSPRKPFFMGDYFLFMASLGCLHHCKDALDWYFKQNFENISLAQKTYRFLDYVVAGRWDRVPDELVKLPDEFPTNRVDLVVDAHKTYWQWVLQIDTQQEPTEKALEDAATKPDFYHALCSMDALLVKDHEKAMHHARLHAMNISGKVSLGYLFEHTMIRALLAQKDADGALEMLQQSKDEHPFDDFYKAWIQYQKGNLEAAGVIWKRLKTWVEEFSFQGHLELELKLAAQVRPEDLAALDQAAQQPASQPTFASDIWRAVDLDKVSVYGRSEKMQEIKAKVEALQNQEDPMLIVGPSGSGKSLLARAMHTQSQRGKEPFLGVQCGSLSEAFLQAELFGDTPHGKIKIQNPQAGLLSEVGQGTLFIADAEELSLDLQSALLHVLKTGTYKPHGASRPVKVHGRLVFAAIETLEEEVISGSFNPELAKWISKNTISLPPLQDRVEDIEELAYFYLNENQPSARSKSIAPDLMLYLEKQSWPGNIRELRKTMENLRAFFPEVSELELRHIQMLTKPKMAV